MGKKVISNVDDFLNLKGQCLGVSEWMTISQDIINTFADATCDRQWIHINSERAKLESPFGTTIAHGYLILSLIPHFLTEIIEVRNLKHLVNYAIKDMTFKKAVKMDSRLRMKANLKMAKDLGNICQTSITCLFEVEGEEEPVLEGNIVYLYYFE